LRPTTAERRGGAGPAIAIITDLDGCLLDARRYGFAPARATLRRLRDLRIPLVICTSKTRAEVRALFAELGSRHLAVIEDGGGVLVPPGMAARAPLPRARRTRDGRLVALAPPYRRVREAFPGLSRRTGGAVRGFGDLDDAGVAAVTGLSRAAARRARRREFDEPFFFVRGERRHLAVAEREARARGLVVSRGGRFYHLHGRTDKGRAARLVRRILERELGPTVLIALGDSALDAPFLVEAERPIIVPRPDGRPDPRLRRLVPGARLAPAPGPAGWARAVAAALREPAGAVPRGARSRPGPRGRSRRAGARAPSARDPARHTRRPGRPPGPRSRTRS
jgi:mannosyl-3-phosphoglycerate phosphatase family protein